MADVLESVLSGQILMNDLINWLKSNNSDVAQLQLTDNSDFIPYFINYLKDGCSWLLSKTDKNNETLIVDKSSAQEIHSLPNKQIQLPPKKYIVSESSNGYAFPNETTARLDLTGKTNVIKNSYEKPSPIQEHTNKKVQILTFGCAPYQPKRRENRFSKESNFIKDKPAIHSYAYSPVSSKANGTDINNLDAFPPLGAKADVDSKARRRITPTPVQVVSNGSSKFGRSNFDLSSNKFQSELFRTSPFQDKGFDFQHERNLLKQTRDKLGKQPLTSPSQNEPNQIDVKVCNVKSPPDPYIFPDPENISMEQDITVFIQIYCFLITNALLPNITSELYFMFEMITSKVTLKDEPTEKNVFSSIHNCVYFAVSVLSQQCHLLYMLDNTTLASLGGIPYLLKFSPQLVYYLQLSCTVKQDSTVSLPSLTRVPFQLDDDSRSNFSDDNSFISFKKQRDLFYELLREWQEQSLECVDAKNQDKFARKAKLLISLGPNPLNMYHLARLFQSQLIASCICFEVNEVYDEVVSDIQKNFPAKFRKLQERFLTPTRVGGLTPPPSFYGIQAFFSELIIAAASPSLNQHLINVFVCKILELNDTDVFSDGELSSLGTLKDKYIFLLHTLRLLGKFLGYIHFLPYSTGQSIPIHIASYLIEARNHSIPPLDLPLLLGKAVQDNHIILTVPWVVEYLSMMDPLAQSLKHVQEAMIILTDIYRWDIFMSEDLHSVLFLRLIIGWLFDVLHYPKKYCTLLQPISFQYSQKTRGKGVDTVAVIDKQLIHSCCPYLIEFKVLVFNFLNDIKNKREVRKITPFSTIHGGISSSTAKQQMESELEESFFFLHPQSLKKTSDFIAERMASKAINKIRMEVTNSKLSIVKDIVSSEAYKLICSSDESTLQKQQEILKLLDSSIRFVYDDIRYKVRDVIENIRKDINKTIPILLSEDTKQTVIDVCCQISFRFAANKVTEWCDSNLLLDAIKSDVKSKVQHLSKGEKDIVASKNFNASHWLSVFRSAIAKIHSKSENINTETLLHLCSKMSELMENETSNIVKKTVVSLSVDLYIALIVHYPEQCCERLTENCVLIWSSCSKKLVPEKLFLCPQNMTFLLLSKNFEISCEKYVYVVKYLLNNNVFTITKLQSCLKEISELDWQDAALRSTLESFTDILSS